MKSVSRGGLIGRLSDDFEMAWRQAPPAAIEEFYRRALDREARVLDEASRIDLLEELIKLDMEFRWRPGGVARARWGVGDYVRAFAELRGGAWRAEPLVCEEFRVRTQWGDRPTLRDFARDYPHLEPQLSERLLTIETSLRAAAPKRSLSETGPYVPATGAPAPPAPVARRSSAAPVVPGYEIRGELGRGGMGVVYQAWDVRLKRLVALKIILSGGHAGLEEMARFRKEAQTIAKLKHPNIVQVFEFGDCDNRPYFALEFVGGGSLSEYLRGAPQPPALAAGFLGTLARAMAVAHRAGIVHRDLKPANILLEIDAPAPAAPDRRPPLSGVRAKITDFGLAKELGDAGEQTRTGAIMGTPSYMAPEQAEGRTKEVGPAADLYALGAILYELLIGRPPLKGASIVETLDLVRKREPVAPRLLQPAVPLDLETICLKCLRKDPGQRYDSAEALADDLERFGRGEPIRARPVGSVEQAWKFYRRNPRVVYAGTGLIVLLLVALVASGTAAVLSASRASAFVAKAKAERDTQTAETDKLVAEGETLRAEAAAGRAALGQKKAEGDVAKAGVVIDSQNYDLLIGLSERELSSPKGDVALAEKNLDACDPKARGWEWNYLVRKLDGERAPLTGHDAGLWSVAFHPNNREIATASIDGHVRLWDVDRGTSTPFQGHKVDTAGLQNTAQLVDGIGDLTSALAGGIRPTPKVGDVPKHISPVLRVAYSADGRTVASGALNPNVANPRRSVGTVLVWNRDGPIGKPFTGHNVLVTALAFHPNGRQIASAGMDDDCALVLWDIATKRVDPERFAGHTGWISQARFSRDGRRVATGSADGTAILWDAATKAKLRVFPDHHATVHDLAFSADGRSLATAGMDGRVLVWDLAAPGAKPVELRGHIGSALGVAFSPDGKRVASAGFDRTVRLWDPVSGAEKITLRGHTDSVWSVAFSADGLKLASASFDGDARIWDGTPVDASGPAAFFTVANGPGERRTDEDHRVNRIAFSADGRRMATASWDRTAEIRDADTGAPLFKLPHDGPVWGVAFSPKGDRILTGSWDATVRLWDAATHAPIRAFGAGAIKSPVQCVAFSHDGRTVAAGCWDGGILLWDAETGAARSPKLNGHYLPVFGLAFSPDDRFLVSASGDRTAKIWPLDGGKAFDMPGHTATVFTVAFDPAGRRIATASWDGTVRLWTYARGQATLEHVLQPKSERGKKGLKGGHADCVNSVAFSPDGAQLATVSNDKTLQRWEASGGRPIGGPQILRGVIWDVAYHPDGTRLAAAVWNPKGWIKVLASKP